MNGTKVRWGPIVAVVGPANSNSRKKKLAAHGLALAWSAAACSDEELVDGRSAADDACQTKADSAGSVPTTTTSIPNHHPAIYQPVTPISI